MASPTVAATNTSTSSGNTTIHTLNMPATVEVGDLLLAIVGIDGTGGTVTPPTDWEILDGPETNAGTVTFYVFGKIAVGDEDSDALTFGTSTVERISAVVYAISGWSGTLEDLEFIAATTGTSANPNSGNIAPSAGLDDYLFISFGTINDGRMNITTAPSGYSPLITAQDDNTAGVQTYAAVKAATAASDDPGNFVEQDLFSSQWVNGGVAVPPTSGPPVYGVSDPTTSVADMERAYLIAANGDVDAGSLTDLREAVYPGYSEPALYAVYTAASVLTPVEEYSLHDHIRSGLENL